MMMRLLVLVGALVASISAEDDYIGCYQDQYNSVIFTEELQWFGNNLTPEVYEDSWMLN